MTMHPRASEALSNRRRKPSLRVRSFLIAVRFGKLAQNYLWLGSRRSCPLCVLNCKVPLFGKRIHSSVYGRAIRPNFSSASTREGRNSWAIRLSKRVPRARLHGLSAVSVYTNCFVTPSHAPPSCASPFGRRITAAITATRNRGKGKGTRTRRGVSEQPV